MSATVFAVTVIVLALLLGLFRLALTQVPERRDQIEAWAAQAIGQPVELGSVDARLGLRGPELIFTDARILSADGSDELIHAQEGSITLDLVKLLSGRIVPGRILLSGVEVSILREADGTWQLLGPGGPALAGGGHGIPPLDSLPVSEVRLTDLDVRFEDRMRGLGPWLFTVSSVDMAVQDQGASVEASIGLPEVLGRGVQVQARMTGQDPEGLPLGWSVQLDAQGLDLAAGHKLLADVEGFPLGGTMSFQLQFAGSRLRPERLVGRVAASDLAFSGDPQPEPYERVGARLDWSGGETAWQLRVSDLDVRRAGRRWRSPTARIEASGPPDARVIYADADFLRLEDLTPLAVFMPKDRAELVAGVAPAGGVRSLVVRVEPGGDAGDPEVSFKGELERVGFRPHGKMPGLSNISGGFEGTARSGRLSVDSRNMRFLSPWLFRDPLDFSAAATEITWSRDDTGFRVEAKDLSASNPDLTLDGEAALKFPADGSPMTMDIHARVRDVNVSSASRYLPVGIMPDGVVAWLDRSLVSGEVPEAVLDLRGPSKGFPYRNDQGIFRVSFPIENLVLDFAEGWPAADGVRADVLFENEAFFADVSSGKLMELDAGPVAVQIPDLNRGELGIKGRASGPAAAGRDWILATDLLRDLLAPGLEPARIEKGHLDADVDLLLPLTHLHDNDVKVDLDLSDVDVKFDYLGVPVQGMGGQVHIHGPKVTGDNLTASVRERPVTLALGPDASGGTRLSLSGRTSVETIDALFGMDFGSKARGEAAYDGHLDFPGDGNDQPFNLKFQSGLEGVEVDLPPPFGKPAASRRPVELSVAFPSPDAQDWTVRVDDLTAAFRLEQGEQGLRLGRVAAPPAPAPGPDRDGIVLAGRLASLDLTDWLSEGLAPAGTGVGGAADLVAAAHVEVGALDTPVGRYDDVGADVTREPGTWRLELNGDSVRGSVRIPEAAGGKERIEADMQRLDVFPPRPEEEQEAAAQDAAGSEPAQPGWTLPAKSVPAMFIKVEDFRIGGIRLGAALLDIVSTPDGVELKRFDGGAESFRFLAYGRSVDTGTQRLSELHLELSSTDIEATLASVGYAPAMTGKSGKFVADLSWPGGPRSDLISVMGGSASLDFKSGRLTAVGTGAGRIFGLLSLQALPRRLTLDFSDVFGGGLGYDEIKGSFEIAGGDAYTTNLVLRGPTVDIGMVGRIGLATRDYDQTAVVSADVGAAVPVAGAIAAGPIVGAALWVLSEALKNPLRTQITYRVTGPWDNPDVERVASGTQPASGTRPPDQSSGSGESGSAQDAQAAEGNQAGENAQAPEDAPAPEAPGPEPETGQ